MTTPESSQPEDYSNLVDTQEKGRNYLFYIVIILFVLVLVGVFSFYSPNQEIELEAPLSLDEIDPTIQSQIDAAKPSSTAEEKTKPGEDRSISVSSLTAPAGSTQTSNRLSTGDTARSLIRSIRQGEQNLTMDQLYEQASKLQNQAMATDAYLLYFFAARKGHGPSAFELATMHDPAYFVAGSQLLDEPDPVQAYKWYTIAAESNVKAAKERLQALRSSIEVAAANGDLSAQRLLLNWK